jgi:uncharacterized protein YbbC (DUF1343 family)
VEAMMVNTALDRPYELRKELEGRTCILVSTNSSVNKKLEQSFEIIRRLNADLKAVVAPEHGFFGSKKEGQRVEEAVDQDLGLRLLSWYSEKPSFRDEWLEGVDAVVYDIQDGGVRYHTYLSTLKSALLMCSKKQVRLIVLDRPNPIRGDVLEGNIPKKLSIVCSWYIPVRYGLTPGELANLVKREQNLKCELKVIKLSGWKRAMWFDETALPWVQISPNTPTLTTCIVYPGTCIFEGTTLSVGRGTTKPFELIGSPWLDAKSVVERFNSLKLPGVKARYVRFLPWYSRYNKRECKGVQLHVLDRNRFQPLRCALHLLKTMLEIHGDKIFEENAEHFDLLLGDDSIQKSLLQGVDVEELVTSWAKELSRYKERIKPILLYR